MSTPADREIVVNGVDGNTGDYLLPPLDADTVAQYAVQDQADAAITTWLSEVAEHQRKPRLGLPFGVAPEDVASARWGVVFARDEAPEIRAALAPLVEHRTHALGTPAKELEYQVGETWRTWLVRNGVAPGTIAPECVPYYLVLVGGPESIPYRFQYLLDSEYAVGRLAFRSADEYARYVASLIEYESAAAPPHGRSTAFFGTHHPGDRATSLSDQLLLEPLTKAPPGVGDGWRPTVLRGAKAKRNELQRVLRGDADGRPYALCFTATHGIGFRSGDPLQADCQGALVCQDWPGPGRVRPEHYLAAQDVPSDARVHGLVAFLFACYGAGTPDWDDYLQNAAGTPERIADRPFVARLPQALLAHPGGGALAVIGHVERAWSCSFLPAGQKPQLLPFRNALEMIIAGLPVGHCLKDLRGMYTSLSAALSDALGEIRRGATYPPAELASLWLARNDARNYTLLGDPAARLRTA